MKLSATEIVSDGFTLDYAFSFVGEGKGYLRNSDLSVTVEGNAVPYTMTSPNTIILDEAPEEGKIILIRRVMPKDKTYADFRKGNNFREQVINNSFLQTLYTIHELLDGYFSGDVEFQDAVTFLKDVYISGVLKAGVVEVHTDTENPSSSLNIETGDARYIRQEGGEMSGPLKLTAPQGEDDAVRLKDLEAEAASREVAIKAILSIISGEAPVESSAFSPISWHKQVIELPVEIPPNVNAWSFGPQVSVASGASVIIGEGSYLTIANGEVL